MIGLKREYWQRVENRRLVTVCKNRIFLATWFLSFLSIGGAVKIITNIENLAVIRKILAHLNAKSVSAGTGLVPESRGPPQASLLREIHQVNDLLQ